MPEVRSIMASPIPVEERLPEVAELDDGVGGTKLVSRAVLVYCRDLWYMAMLEQKPDGSNRWLGRYSMMYGVPPNAEVTHWLPMPPKPE